MAYLLVRIFRVASDIRVRSLPAMSGDATTDAAFAVRSKRESENKENQKQPPKMLQVPPQMERPTKKARKAGPIAAAAPASNTAGSVAGRPPTPKMPPALSPRLRVPSSVSPGAEHENRTFDKMLPEQSHRRSPLLVPIRAG